MSYKKVSLLEVPSEEVTEESKNDPTSLTSTIRSRKTKSKGPSRSTSYSQLPTPEEEALKQIKAEKEAKEVYKI